METQTNKDLILDDGSSIEMFNKDYNKFFNRTTIIYGRTDSGKSTIINELMFLLKDHISIPFVICESSVVIKASPYFNKIPNPLIKFSATKAWFEEVLKFQKGRTAIFITANDICNLKILFDKINSSAGNEIEQSIICNSEKYINMIMANTKLSNSQRKKQKDKIEKTQATHLKKLYKNYVRKYKTTLECIKDLTPDEICCINYLDFNPSLLIIYDDCAANFKSWVKSSTSIKEIFYNGRHYNITQIISVQDDKEIDSELRKNALISIFTTERSATSNFERKSNNYQKDEVKYAAICSKKIFDINDYGMEKNFRKLIYMLNAGNKPFQYTIADIPEDFQLGCPALWKIDTRLKDLKKNNLSSNNAFFDNYYNV